MHYYNELILTFSCKLLAYKQMQHLAFFIKRGMLYIVTTSLIKFAIQDLDCIVYNLLLFSIKYLGVKYSLLHVHY